MGGLREYQTAAIGSVIQALTTPEIKATALIAPTGSGKTVMGAELMRLAIQEPFMDGLRDAAHSWLTHRVVLETQSGGALEQAGVPVNYLREASKASDRRYDANTVNVVPSGMRATPQLPERLGLLVVDEAHHCAMLPQVVSNGSEAPTYDYERSKTVTAMSKYTWQWKQAGGVVVGLTATLWRLSKRQSFAPLFDCVAAQIPKSAIRGAGHLATPELHVPYGVHILGEDLKVIAGDFDKGDVNRKVIGFLKQTQVHPIWEREVSNMGWEGRQRATLWFLPTVEAALKLSEQLPERCEVLTGDTKNEEREAMFARLQNGDTTHLVAIDCVSEGVDIPDVRTVCLMRPTMSEVVFFQQCGRAERPKQDDNRYLVIDFAGNTLLHGNPGRDRDPDTLDCRSNPGNGEPPLRGCVCRECYKEAWGCGQQQMSWAERYCRACKHQQFDVCQVCRHSRPIAELEHLDHSAAMQQALELGSLMPSGKPPVLQFTTITGESYKLACHDCRLLDEKLREDEKRKQRKMEALREAERIRQIREQEEQERIRQLQEQRHRANTLSDVGGPKERERNRLHAIHQLDGELPEGIEEWLPHARWVGKTKSGEWELSVLMNPHSREDPFPSVGSSVVVRAINKAGKASLCAVRVTHPPTATKFVADPFCPFKTEGEALVQTKGVLIQPGSR